MWLYVLCEILFLWVDECLFVWFQSVFKCLSVACFNWQVIGNEIILNHRTAQLDEADGQLTGLGILKKGLTYWASDYAVSIAMVNLGNPVPFIEVYTRIQSSSFIVLPVRRRFKFNVHCSASEQKIQVQCSLFNVYCSASGQKIQVQCSLFCQWVEDSSSMFIVLLAGRRFKFKFHCSSSRQRIQSSVFHCSVSRQKIQSHTL